VILEGEIEMRRQMSRQAPHPLKAILQRQGITQEQVADALGISRGFVNAMLTCAVKMSAAREKQIEDMIPVLQLRRK